jgi:hypothetical protein
VLAEVRARSGVTSRDAARNILITTLISVFALNHATRAVPEWALKNSNQTLRQPASTFVIRPQSTRKPQASTSAVHTPSCSVSVRASSASPVFGTR